MKYSKPEVKPLAHALDAIQGNKDAFVQMDSAFPHPWNASIGAYQADE